MRAPDIRPTGKCTRSKKPVGALGDIPPVGEPPPIPNTTDFVPGDVDRSSATRPLPERAQTVDVGTVTCQRVRRNGTDLAEIATPSQHDRTQNRPDVATTSPPPRHHLARTYRAARRNLGSP